MSERIDAGLTLDDFNPPGRTEVLGPLVVARRSFVARAHVVDHLALVMSPVRLKWEEFSWDRSCTCC